MVAASLASAPLDEVRFRSVADALLADGRMVGVELRLDLGPRFSRGDLRALRTVESEVPGVGLLRLHLPDPDGRDRSRFGEYLLLYVALNAAGLAVMTAVARVVVQREEQARALAEARSAASMLALESLRRKLEPHFLFNSLNALRATIRTDPMLARELVLDLADLYRYLLHHPDDSTLAAEFDHARAYLRIERARLGQSRLSVDSELPDALRNHRVPALLLQPLVENAVKHGIATRKAGGSVRISAFTNERYIFIEVRDRGTGELLGAPEPGSGIALAALKESLDRRFGDEASIDLEVGDAETLARVRLPLASTDPRRES